MKSKLRKEFLNLRKEMSSSSHLLYSNEICKKVVSLIEKYDFNKIALYSPFKNEVDVTSLIRYFLKDKKVLLPYIKDKKMYFSRIKDLDDLELGSYNILKPKSFKPENDFEICIVPGVAFNEDKYRLGYGGGFYDRYFEVKNNTLLIGVFFELQKTSIKFETFNDITLDYIITEKNIYN
jgi:5-formyltetrahydrofolate cyclo-ligase